jgi:glycosyltransferase involved in cell wall biosynthesis
MRVTFVLPTLDYSGGNRVVAMHAAGLTERGHRVNVVVPRPGAHRLRASIGRWLPERLEAALGGGKDAGGSHVEDLGLKPIVAAQPGAVRADDVPDADVIVATWWETAEWIQAMPAPKGAQAYFVQGYEVFDYTPKDRVQATYRAPLRRITISKWLQDLLARDFGDSDVDLVPNGVDLKHFSCPSRDKQSEPTVGFIATTTPVKGLATAIAALLRLHAVVPGLRVLAFGSQAFAARELGDLPLQYLERPTQAQIRDIYSRCDVWLAASHSEGFGLPALEAMACRTPVVSTRTGWPAHGIVDGVNGYLAEPGDDATLARHLSTVLTLAPQDWLRMSQAAYSTASALTWDQSTSLFEAALRRTIDERSAVAAGPTLCSERV